MSSGCSVCVSCKERETSRRPEGLLEWWYNDSRTRVGSPFRVMAWRAGRLCV